MLPLGDLIAHTAKALQVHGPLDSTGHNKNSNSNNSSNNSNNSKNSSSNNTITRVHGQPDSKRSTAMSSSETDSTLREEDMESYEVTEKRNESEMSEKSEKFKEEKNERAPISEEDFLLFEWKNILRSTIAGEYSSGEEKISGQERSSFNVDPYRNSSKNGKYGENGENGESKVNTLNVLSIVNTSFTRYVTQLQLLGAELTTEIRAESLDKDLEIEGFLLRVRQGSRRRSPELPGGEGSGNNGNNRRESEEKSERSLRIPNNTSNAINNNTNHSSNGNNDNSNKIRPPKCPSVLDTCGVSFSAPPIGTREVLARCKDLFRRTEDLCAAASCLIEMVSFNTVTQCSYKSNSSNSSSSSNNSNSNKHDTDNTPHTSHTAHIAHTGLLDNESPSTPNALQSALALKEALTSLVKLVCNALESVSTVLYVLPSVYAVSPREWGEWVACFLDCRSACMYVLTSLLSYNASCRRALGRGVSGDGRGMSGGGSGGGGGGSGGGSGGAGVGRGGVEKKSVRVSYTVPLGALEEALGDIEVILEEEVRQL